MSPVQPVSAPPGFFTTIRLLLRVARVRAAGRKARQRELLNQRTAKRSRSDPLRWISWAAGFLLPTLFHVLVAVTLAISLQKAQRVDSEQTGHIVVSSPFYRALQQAYPKLSALPLAKIDVSHLDHLYPQEAARRAERVGGTADESEDFLLEAVAIRSRDDFVDAGVVAPGLVGAAGTFGAFPAMIGVGVLVWWLLTMILQGEGLELDLQRRRHPHWEWLASHPVSPVALFLAELLAPIAANPVYLTGPIFIGLLYAMLYGANVGLMAAMGAGVPLGFATACMGKALEMAIMLRFSPRTRGACIGIMSWLGYVLMMVACLVPVMKFGITDQQLAHLYGASGWLPWTYGMCLLGLYPDGPASFVHGLILCDLLALALIGLAVTLCLWGAQRGLAGHQGAVRVATSRARRSVFEGEPVYRKELLWFRRDRSAIVQAILIPISLAGVEVLRLRMVFSGLHGEWNQLCAMAIVLGTYFLWVLGPKSLASEGPALWITLTWPHGLESLLQAKARLWSMLASAIVASVLGYALWQYPADAWKIALIAVGWLAFSRSMAEKAVTLVAPASSSGEMEAIPPGRRLAASFGTVTFGLGVMSQQWQLAVMGIVYSWMTAAAMWQNFRARLPYLYDPWSERLPPPPTLMHAMIAISVLVEGGALLMVAAIALAGAEYGPLVQFVTYAVCASVTALVVSLFLRSRGVQVRTIWFWVAAEGWNLRSAVRRSAPFVLVGIASGLALGAVAHSYLALLNHIPQAAEMIRTAQEQLQGLSGSRVYLAVMAIGIAPLAEEFLFRGMLYRALDREWGGWKAITGSAVFFAIYHPPLAWIPVGLLGIANALIYRQSRSLVPAVALHMTYNATVFM